MESAKKGINLLDSFKQKLTDKEYKEMCDCLQNISKTENQISEKTYKFSFLFSSIETMFCHCEATRFRPNINSTTIKTRILTKNCCTDSSCEVCTLQQFFMDPNNIGVPKEVSVTILKHFLVETPQLNFQYGHSSLLYAYNCDDHCDDSDIESEDYKVLKVNFIIYPFVTVINCGPV
jgi:hypothetical protein